MALAPGTRLGSYEILAPLGAGGMGEVWRARDTRLGRPVALKVLPEDFFESEERRQRFEREARLLASLNHPGIAVLYSFEEIPSSTPASSSRHILVMELLEGETLRSALDRGVLPRKKALDFAAQVAEALASAHEKEIVHRDVKPENIFLTKEGRAKLLDFGIARRRTPIAPADTATPTITAVSEAGVLVGTVAYMSPEQARGAVVDFRSDQFSLGVVLYEMLTGKRPFGGASPTETLAAILRDEPEPLEKLAPAVPAHLRWIVERCLAKEASERYDSTKDLWRELDNCRTHPGGVEAAVSGPAKATPRRQIMRTSTLVGGVLLAVVIGASFAARLLKTKSPPASPVRLSISFPLDAAPPMTGNFNPIALSPDGRTLAFSGGKLFVRSLDSEEVRAISGTEGAVSPFFSPDGLWVGFFAQGKLKKVPLTGGSPVDVCDIREARLGASGAGSWGADDVIVYSPGFYSGLRRVSASGGDSRQLTTVDAASLESHRFPQILPDGEHVLFQIEMAGPKPLSRAVVISIRTGDRRILMEDAAYPRYVPTGHLAFTRAGSLLVAPLSLKRLEVSGLPVPMLDDLVTSRQFTRAAHMDFSSNGTLVYRSMWQFPRALVWVDRTGSVEALPFPPRNYYQTALSPDATRLAAIVVQKDESNALLVGDMARGTLTVSPAEGFFQALAWSPDGRRIALDHTAVPQGIPRVSWLSPDGSRPLERLTDETMRQELPASFSPDGSVLLCTVKNWEHLGASETDWDIYALSLRGAKTAYPFLNSRAAERAPVFSPDGHWVAYASNESGRYEVYVRPYPGPGPKSQVSAEGGDLPRWAKRGAELFYRKGDRMMAVDVVTKPAFHAGRPRTLFEGLFLRSYDVDPDGSRFLMIRRDPAELGQARLNVILNWFEDVKRRVPGTK